MRLTRLLTIAAFVLGSVGAAQALGPTTGFGADAIAKGADTATVAQTVNLIIPQATALHLDVSKITFDLTGYDGATWPNSSGAQNFGPMVCVYGFGADQTSVLGDNFYGQTQVLPLGTYYAAGAFPNINIVGNGAVTAYPPIKIDAQGELVPGSKNYFVCYKSFILQKFSNGLNFELTVTRTDPKTDGAIQHLYIQDNPCDTFGSATGLYQLDFGGSLSLIPKNLQAGPTGKRAAAAATASCQGKSWLDDLVVMAVRVNADLAGTNAAALTYTLHTTAW